MRRMEDETRVHCIHCKGGEGCDSCKCEYCNGTGEAQESCCGAKLNDYGICPDCKEHTYQLGDACDMCDGTGILTN